MEEKNSVQRKPSAELRKIGVLMLRVSMLVLVVTVVGSFLGWFHWSWVVLGVSCVLGAYLWEVVLNAIADISEKVDRLVENSGKDSGE